MRGEPIIVKQLLQKAKDSALLAVEFYNKPAVSFKSEGFITMMCVAWTSLFHAYFFKKRIKPYYRKTKKGKRPHFEKIKETLPNGETIVDYKWWDLSKCITEYFKDKTTPVRSNLEFFSRIRDLIVHRNIPDLDPDIFGECQANILNFNQVLIENFGENHRIDYMLSYSLQMFSQPKNFIEATKKELKKKNAQEVVEFIKSFRSSLSDDIYTSDEYSFKAVLIKVQNHQSKDALALRFVNEKDLTEEQKEQLRNNFGILLVKEKKVDDVPPQYRWDYKELVRNLKDNFPNSFKQNKEFHLIKKSIIEKNQHLRHQRKLDPKNPNSTKKDYYDPKILEEFEKYYN
jgi:hypothetical protein